MGVLIYLPFVRISDVIRVMQGRRALPALYKIATCGETAQPLRACLDHPGEMGRLSKALLRDLEKGLANHNQLYVVYQPQLDGSGQQVLGVEALLR